MSFAHWTAAADTNLELYAFMTKDSSNLFLRITNRGDTPQTILTEGYSRSWGDANGRRLPHLDLSYEISSMGPVEEPDRWVFMPSLPKLAPVTLHKNETAQIVVPIDEVQFNAIRTNNIVSLRYIIGKRIAERFGLWHGTLELKESYESVRSK